MSQTTDSKKKSPSKSLKKLLEYNERQYFQGPPENTKECITHAAKALQQGDWQKAYNFIKEIKIWTLFTNSDEIKQMVQSKLQIEALRTYIFQYKKYYDKLSIEKLAERFSLNKNQIISIISKMIFNEEIDAALDQKNGSISFNKGYELTKLQQLSLQLADKAGSLAEKNERLAAGGHQQTQGNNSGFNIQGSNSNFNNKSNNNNNRNKNYKIAKDANGIISGALTGMARKNHKRKHNNVRAN